MVAVPSELRMRERRGELSCGGLSLGARGAVCTIGREVCDMCAPLRPHSSLHSGGWCRGGKQPVRATFPSFSNEG
jgi:hypothetical protein